MIRKVGPATATNIDKRVGRPGHGSLEIGEFVTAPHLEGLFQPKDFNYQQFTDYFVSDLTQRKDWRDYITTLRGCAAAAEVYELLPDARISAATAKQDLSVAKWIPRARQYQGSPLRLTLERPEVFACIAMFEHGYCNLDPAGLKHVFAISSGNSMYVAGPLLCDPYEQTKSYEIRRVPGNIGRAGISLLVPPPIPKMLKPDLENWEFLDYKEFQGQLENNFGETTVHLSFTDFNMPLSLGTEEEHIIDRPIRLLETLASVYDRRRWIADLDILRALESGRLLRINCTDPTKHHDAESAQRSAVYFDVFQDAYEAVANDNWDEIIGKNEGPLNVVRAKDNWLARLAVVAVCIQQGRTLSLLPGDGNICWQCCKAHLEEDKATRKLLVT